MFLILVASNALDGTLLDYRPPTFQVWERGVWERGTWGMNDDFDPASGGGAPTTGFARRRAATFLRKNADYVNRRA
jgi:hypothetical protein